MSDFELFSSDDYSVEESNISDIESGNVLDSRCEEKNKTNINKAQEVQIELVKSDAEGEVLVKVVIDSNEVFDSREALVKYIRNIGAHDGYGVVCGRSNKDRQGNPKSVYLTCDKGKPNMNLFIH